MTEKPNYPVVTPYPKHFWHDALGCHWCGRKTDNMVSDHDGMCPVPVVAHFENILGTFDNQPTKYMLRLIAGDLTDTSTHADVKRARANWLIRFVKAIEGN